MPNWFPIRLPILIAAALLIILCPHTSLLAQTTPSDRLPSVAPKFPLRPRCALIGAHSDQALASHIDLLQAACQYALSPESLPNFICQETILRQTNGHALDVITDEVTVMLGRDRYSNYTRNGKPVDSIEDTGGFGSDALFATELNAIFRANTQAEFAFKRETKINKSPASEFTFHFDHSGSSHFGLADSYPGMAGTITVDQQTRQLRHVEVEAKKIDSKRRLKSYKSNMNYAGVPIPELGNVLLPVSGEAHVCLQDGTCFNNKLSFHDCRKFGSESRMLPDQAPDPTP